MSTIADISPQNSGYHSECSGSPSPGALTDMISRNKFLEGNTL